MKTTYHLITNLPGKRPHSTPVLVLKERDVYFLVELLADVDIVDRVARAGERMVVPKFAVVADEATMKRLAALESELANLDRVLGEDFTGREGERETMRHARSQVKKDIEKIQGAKQ